MILEWKIANRYLKSKRKESFISFISWFSLIGIMLGVAVLIIVISVMNGFRKEIVSNIVSTSGHISISTPYNKTNGNKMPNYQAKIQNISTINAIISAVPIINSEVLLSSKNNTTGALATSMTFDDLTSRDVFKTSLNNVDLSGFKNNNNVVLIGRIIARNLSLKIGDDITFISPNGYTTLVGSVPKFGTFKIIGILNTGMYAYDSGSVILPLARGQDFFNYKDSVQKIEIFVHNVNDVRKIKSDLLKLPNIGIIETWEESNFQLINALIVERNVMFLILTLIILIAVFNIISGLIMMVRSKTKEIAILRTIGLTRRSIITVFLIMGLRIGIMGTVFGATLGLLFSYNIQNIRVFLESLLGFNLFSEEIYFLSKLPSDVQSPQVIAIISIALISSIISALYPALRASKINPVEGLKYD